MEPEIAFIVTYRCPRCQVALEVAPGQADTWLRCPECGRPSLPPTVSRPFVAPPSIEGEVLYIGEFERLGSIPPAVPIPARSGSALRIGILAGCLIAGSLLVLALLDQDTAKAAVFGCVALVCLGILAVPRRRI